MDAILATGITGLFAYWVWRLKHELGRLQHEIFRSPSVAMAHDGPTHVTVLVPSGDLAAQNDVKKEIIQRKSPDTEGGIPTWTLG